MGKYNGKNMDIVNEENGKFLNWILTFTKKIVSVFSILYIIVIIVIVCMLGYELKSGITDGLSTMISELNETFRVVIGGYLIKAGLENTFKITGSFLAGINKDKLQASIISKTEDEEDFCEENSECEEDTDI